MEIDKSSILLMVPDFLETLNDSEFKNALLAAKSNPEILSDPMAMMQLVSPKLSVILSKHGFNSPSAPQQFIMFLLMNQDDPEIKELAEHLQRALTE